MKYIISYVSSFRLDNLEIYLCLDILYKWIDRNSLESIVRFGQHISLIKNLTFDVEHQSKKRSSTITTIRGSRTAKLWLFFNAIRGNRNFNHHTIIKASHQKRKNYDFSLIIRDNNKSMYLNHSLRLLDFFTYSQQGVLSSIFIPLSYATVIKTLDLSISMHDMVPVFNYVFANYLHLSQLSINDDVHNCSFNFKAEDNNNTPTLPTKRNLNIANLSHNLLETISKALPNIKLLFHSITYHSASASTLKNCLVFVVKCKEIKKVRIHLSHGERGNIVPYFHCDQDIILDK